MPGPSFFFFFRSVARSSYSFGALVMEGKDEMSRTGFQVSIISVDGTRPAGLINEALEQDE